MRSFFNSLLRSTLISNGLIILSHLLCRFILIQILIVYIAIHTIPGITEIIIFSVFKCFFQTKLNKVFWFKRSMFIAIRTLPVLYRGVSCCRATTCDTSSLGDIFIFIYNFLNFRNREIIIPPQLSVFLFNIKLSWYVLLIILSPPLFYYFKCCIFLLNLLAKAFY